MLEGDGGGRGTARILEGGSTADLRPADPWTGTSALAGTLSDLLWSAKPRITGLVTLTAAAGYAVAASGAVWSVELLHLVLGTAFLAGGTNAFNQVLEREPDARMARTRDRPLAAGRLSPLLAGAVAAGMVALGTGLLARTNLLTAALGAFAFVLYVGAYTPLKRVTRGSLVVGAVPGALPALGGWTAARGALEPAGLAFFGLLFLWQLPHFLALGWFLREDYRRAGFETFALGAKGGSRSGRWAVLAALALLPVSLVPAFLGTGGWVYLVGAAGCGWGYLEATGRFAAETDDSTARRLFRASLLYLPAVLLLWVVDARWIGSAGPAPTELAHLNGGLNAVAAGLLALGYAAIRRGRVELHRRRMLGAAAASAVFLASYLVYHAHVGSVPFGGTGAIRTVYLGVLVSHVVLAVLVLPVALVTLARGLAGEADRHRRLARWTLPIWLWVSVSGLIVYGMVHA